MNSDMKKKMMSKLGKMKMPEKQDELSLDENDLGDQSDSENSSQDMGAGSDEADQTNPDNSENSTQLEGISDDELMAEIKKRGLMSQLDNQDSNQADDNNSNSKYL